MTSKDSEEKGRRLTLATASLAFIALAAAFGWTGSFIGLHGYAVQRMLGFTQKTAWAVPGAYDGAALACTLAVYRASINGRSAARGRFMMFAFTAISSWINWTHQTDHTAQLVAAGLPIAAVLVFDFLMTELRADWEAAHGRKAFRMRPMLLILRYLVDRAGTKAAFRDQITAIPVSALAGLGADLTAPADNAGSETENAGSKTPEPEPAAAPIHLPGPTRPADAVPAVNGTAVPTPVPSAPGWLTGSNVVEWGRGVLLNSEPPAWSSLTIQDAVERADAILPDGPRPARELVEILASVGVMTNEAYIRTARGRIRRAAESSAEDAEDSGDVASIYEVRRESVPA